MKYFLLPLGCQMNQSDTERVKTVLQGMGFTPTDNEDEATILGIIACSVRQKGIDKVYSRIKKWNETKDNRNRITFVSGCVLPADRERFLKLFDLVFTMNDLPDLPDMIRQYGVFIPVNSQQSTSNSKYPEATCSTFQREKQDQPISQHGQILGYRARSYFRV